MRAAYALPERRWYHSVMIQPSPRRTGNNKPRKVHVLLRDGGVFEGELFLSDGHSLAPYLSSRKGGWINVVKARWQGEGELHPHAVVQCDDILLAAFADGDLPGNAAPVGPGRDVDIALEDRTRISGRLQLADRQRMSDYLSACGKFIPVMGATRIPSQEPLGDIALNAASIRAVRDPRVFTAAAPSPADAAAEWGGMRRTSLSTPAIAPAAEAPAPAPTLTPAQQARAERLARHWLVQLAGAANLLPPDPGTTTGIQSLDDIWNGIVRRNDLTEVELAVLVVESFKLSLADFDEVTEDALGIVPEKLARKLGVMPVKSDGGTLTVAVSDPASLEIETQLRFVTRLALRFEVASPEEIRGAADWHYGQRAVRASMPWVSA
jgi:hypothetical protein